MKFGIKILFNLILFFCFVSLVLYFWWIVAGKIYVTNNTPVGGDYFNALTYVNFFQKYFFIPPLGWVPFWNEGSPVIGGYPWLAFYLMMPLMIFFDSASSMEIFADISLGLFFVASLLLFKQVSKNWIIAVSLTLILVVTKATYYPLTTGGFVISSTVQWYLPITLLFINLFYETYNKRLLVLASSTTGIAFIQHAPTTMITIFLPILFFIYFYPKNMNFTKKINNIFLYVFISSSIGIMGYYTLLLQIFGGSGKTFCESPECWGVYPKHLIVWLNGLSLVILFFFIIIILISRIYKKNIQISPAFSAIAGFFVLFLYALASYLRLINGPANVFFPTRLFWAANFFSLLISAYLFCGIQKKLKKLSIIFSAVVMVFIITTIYFFPPQIHKDFVNTVPIDAYSYVIAKYKTHDSRELIPSWINLKEKNWRLDTFNPGLTQWWSYASDIPNTRGYAIGTNEKWQYFLQYATREPKNNSEELIKNRAIFLLDAMGVMYRENSIVSYPKILLDDKKLVNRTEQKRDFTWYQFSNKIISPIVAALNSNRVLFIGDDVGYENFIRVIAMTNLNSFSLIPIKGPQNINELTDNDLKKFQGIICYRFKGDNWSKLEDFVKRGGFIFIETASNQSFSKPLPGIYPINSLSSLKVQGPFNARVNEGSEISQDLRISAFSPLIFEEGPWNLTTTDLLDIRPWAKVIISRDNKILLAKGKLKKGTVVLSGINFFYHIVKYDNYEEAKLFKEIIKPVVSKYFVPSFTIERNNPRIIHIIGKDFNGVYFKENYNPGWKAISGDEKLTVYKAGLDFMYVPLEANSNNQRNVTLVFNGDFTIWGLFIFTIFSLVISIIYIIEPKPFNILAYYIYHKGKNMFSSWFDENE